MRATEPTNIGHPGWRRRRRSVPHRSSGADVYARQVPFERPVQIGRRADGQGWERDGSKGGVRWRGGMLEDSRGRGRGQQDAHVGQRLDELCSSLGGAYASVARNSVSHRVVSPSSFTLSRGG